MEATRHSHPTQIDESGSRAVVLGTDVKISQIASEVEHLGMTPAQIVEAHPHLALAQVHAALAYYYDHPEAIRREWKEAQALIATLRALHPGRASRSSQG